MRSLIDTCVIIDALTERSPFEKEAQAILTLASQDKITAFTTSSSVTDLYYNIHRQIHQDQQTRALLSKLLEAVIILNTTRQDCHFALTSPIKDYEDAVLLETAARERVDCLITRNPKDFAESTLPVYTPAEFLKLLDSKTKPKKPSKKPKNHP